MEVLFVTEDYQDFQKKEEKFKESEFDFTTRKTDSKFEILVDENVYDDAFKFLGLKKDKAEKKGKSKVEMESQDKGFMRYVNNYYRTKYSRLIILSLILSFALLVVKIINVVRTEGLEPVKTKDFYLNLVNIFFISFVISQIIFFATRYYKELKKCKKIFIIRFGDAQDNVYDSDFYKALNFILAIVLTILYWPALFFSFVI